MTMLTGISTYETGEYSLVLIRIFVALQILGWTGVTIVLITALVSGNIRRHPTWFSFFVSWIVFCFSYVLLTLTGQKVGTNPGYNLCLVQAALVYGAPPLTAGTTLALVIHLWFTLRVSGKNLNPGHDRIRTLLLVVIPYLIYIAVVSGFLAIGLRNPSSVQLGRSGMYCSMIIRTPIHVSAILVTLIMVVAVTIEVSLVLSLRRSWHSLQIRGSLSMVIRLIVFTILIMTSIGLGFVFLSSPRGATPGLNIFLAFMPVAASVIFGSQVDLIDVWMFWRMETKPMEI